MLASKKIKEKIGGKKEGKQECIDIISSRSR